MLILSRRVGEKVICGNVIVTISRVKGDTVKLGFEAPADVRILREEVAKREAKRGANPDVPAE